MKTSAFEARCLRRGFLMRHIKHLPKVNAARAGKDANGRCQDLAPWEHAEGTIKAGIGMGSLFVLWGPRGTGKTQIATNIGTDIIRATDEREDRWPRYVLMSDIFRDIRASFRKDSLVSEMEAVNAYAKPMLLVIDEAHERGETAFEDRSLTHIIDKRYGAQLDTIIITNLKKDELAKSLGSSIVSRIHESGEAIECNWPSFRERGVQ